jgi:hypothetical protein
MRSFIICNLHRKLYWGGGADQKGCDGHDIGMGEIRNAYKILIRKIENQRPLVRKRCRSKDNIFIFKKCDVTVWTRFDCKLDIYFGHCPLCCVFSIITFQNFIYLFTVYVAMLSEAQAKISVDRIISE